jgi:hypothetical protein
MYVLRPISVYLGYTEYFGAVCLLNHGKGTKTSRKFSEDQPQDELNHLCQRLPVLLHLLKRA